jgi:NCS1 family nucleobase:cation symporter-1
MAGSKSLLTRVIEFLEVEQPANATTSERVLQNHDLLPVPLEQRTWTKFNYFSFWIADSFNINTFMIASSVLGSGIMNWWQCWLSIFLGYVVLSLRRGGERVDHCEGLDDLSSSLSVRRTH